LVLLPTLGKGRKPSPLPFPEGKGNHKESHFFNEAYGTEKEAMKTICNDVIGSVLER
jgi:hypothetical protein